MVRKKVLYLILTVGVIGGMSTYAINYHNSSMQNIKVMEYKPSAQTNEKGYQIDKYQNIESAAWISDNEVLTLTKKGEIKNQGFTETIRYCSIFNLNTKSSKDFKDANIGKFMGVSPEKKYVLYSEAKIFPKNGSSQWQKASDSGDLFHENVKILNLSTGEITNLNTERDNYIAEFIWVSKNKILVNYFSNWSIIDTTGKIYAKGYYNAGPRISGVEDIKDLGTSVEGKFYYTKGEIGKEGVKLYTVDVKTKERKTIFPNQYFRSVDKRGKIIISDNVYNNGEESSDGVVVDRTFGALIMDQSGKKLQAVKLPKGRCNDDYVLSPDGSKVAYVEFNDVQMKNVRETDLDESIKIIDVKTGAIKEIVKASNLKDKDAKIDYSIFESKDKDGKVIQKKRPLVQSISNICWDNTSAALAFSYGNSSAGNSQINTYIVSLDK